MAAAKHPLDSLVDTTFEIGRIMRQRMLCEPGFSSNFLQMHVLMLVNDQSGMTMKELARALHITSPSATSVVNRMTKAGLLSRRHDAANRKLVRLRLTPVGKKFLEQKFLERNRIIKELFAFLTPAEQESLSTLHHKFLREYQRAHP